MTDLDVMVKASLSDWTWLRCDRLSRSKLSWIRPFLDVERNFPEAKQERMNCGEGRELPYVSERYMICREPVNRPSQHICEYHPPGHQQS